MKLTKEKLRQIIKEELSELMAEENLEEEELEQEVLEEDELEETKSTVKDSDKTREKKKKKPQAPPTKLKRDPFDSSRYSDGSYRFDSDDSDGQKDYD